MLLAPCLPAQAQQPKKIPVIGRLGASSAGGEAARIEAFRHGLQELGYIEGKNIVIEWRHAEGKFDRLPALAAELVRLKVEVIVTGGGNATRAVKEATSTIPIVMAQSGDPVVDGFVTSLARPGGTFGAISSLSGVGRQKAGVVKRYCPQALARGRLRYFDERRPRTKVKRFGTRRRDIRLKA